MKRCGLEEKLDELLLQILFSFDQMSLVARFSDISHEKLRLAPVLSTMLKVSRKKVLSSMEIANTIFSRLPELDAAINRLSEGYDITRVTKVDLAILRMAFYDILYGKNYDVDVVIQRAFRLARKFSSDPGCPYLHALVHSLHREQLECAV